MTPQEPFAADATLADVGEFGLISVLTGRFAQGAHVYVGPGDDAAVLRTPKGHVVVSTDLLVEGRHFRREWAKAGDIGRKAAAANLSDVNAMGGTAHSLTVGLAAPADLPVRWALDLADGIAEEAALVGATIVGGDLTTASEVVIAITVMGTCEVAPVLRSGAQAGRRASPSRVARGGPPPVSPCSAGASARRACSSRPTSAPQPPYAAGLAAARAGATAMIDVSDGLVADVGHVAADSGVAIDIERAAFDLAEPMQAVGAALGVDPMQFVLGGGDDHAIVATFPAGTDLPGGLHPDRRRSPRGGRHGRRCGRTTGPRAGRTSERCRHRNTNRPRPGGRGRSSAVFSASAGDLAGLEAAGADVETLGGAVDGGAHALDVGVEATLRDLARPRSVVAEARLLGADVADGSHRALLGLELRNEDRFESGARTRVLRATARE